MTVGWTRVEQEFLDRGVVRGNILLLRPRDAILLVRRCCELGVAVLGVDGFHLRSTGLQPDLGESVDLSEAGTVPDSCDQAEAFLTRRIEADLYFEVVVDETPIEGRQRP